MATLDAQPEAVKQAAVADRLVISKADLVESDTLQALTTRLHALNPGASPLHAAYGAIDPAALLDAGPFTPDGKHIAVTRWLGDEAHAVRPAHHHHHHDLKWSRLLHPGLLPDLRPPAALEQHGHVP